MADVSTRPVTRLLVANRGEIARRIFRTAHKMGIGTVAIYADGDANSPFVREADRAVALGGTSPLETYLDIDKVITAARNTGADAVHPGYGFLSENAGFARAVTTAGMTWIGPSAEAIERMGDKLAAKQLITAADVPTLPAVELTPDEDIDAAAEAIGYPVLVKASAGGGGRGMRVVENPGKLAQAVEGARREAGAAFGNDTLFLERWVTQARHVEIQILGDQHGELVHLFERECSIQRRHQKIIEEAPSPVVNHALRARMGEAALAAAREMRYTSAGTVEFLLDGEAFWFLEVNTRLQVEHPVTEAITGIDLVREQLRIAEGEPLGYTQADLSIDGHAIEARLYAENPAKNFLPAPGSVQVWAPSPDVRGDSGVESGTEVSMNFDPMIAKVIAHAPTRREAAAKLARALERTRVQGIVNNRDFLVATLRHPAFIAHDTTTNFIERIDPPRVRDPSSQEKLEAVIACALHAQAARRANTPVLRGLPSGWRNSRMPPERVTYTIGKETLALTYRRRRDGTFWTDIDGVEHDVDVHAAHAETIELSIGGTRASYIVAVSGPHRHVHGPSGEVVLTETPRFPVGGGAEFQGGLFAPMPGKVLVTEVRAGDRVKEGQLLVILEAMKMEHRITAPVAGVIKALNVTEGEQVDNGQVLVVFEDAE